MTAELHAEFFLYIIGKWESSCRFVIRDVRRWRHKAMLIFFVILQTTLRSVLFSAPGHVADVARAVAVLILHVAFEVARSAELFGAN